VKTAANTSLPHEAAIACQHFHALPFCQADNSIQHKSTFPSKETQQNILIGYTLPHDKKILTIQSTAYVDRTNHDKLAETRQVRPGRNELDKVSNAEYVYLREGRSRHKFDPKYTGPFKVDRRHGTEVWIWRNGHLEPHKLDRVIAAGQLDLGDASEGSSSDSEVALRSHEYLNTPGGTRDTEVSRPDVSRAGSPTGHYPDQSRRESVSDRLCSQAGRHLQRPGRWDDFVMY